MPRSNSSADLENGAKLTLKLPRRSLDRLDRLVDETEATSKSEVLRNALRLYEAVIYGKKEGRYVFIEDKNGKKDSVI